MTSETKRAFDIFISKCATDTEDKPGLVPMLDAVADIQSDAEALQFIEAYHAFVERLYPGQGRSTITSNVPMLWDRFDAGTVLQQGQLMNALTAWKAANPAEPSQ